MALMLFLRHRKRKKKCGEEQPEGLVVRSHRQDVAEVTTVVFFVLFWGFFGLNFGLLMLDHYFFLMETRRLRWAYAHTFNICHSSLS